MNCVHGSAQWTGGHRTTATPEQAVADRERLEDDISRLCAQGAYESKMARQVEINLQLKTLLAECQRIVKYL